MMRSWLSLWRCGKARPRPQRVHPRLEALEDRRVPAVFNPLPNIPDGAPGSLRAGIITANHNGQDNIINLQPGHYLLTIPNTAGEENAAATGDLDITAVGHTITIQGAGADVTILDAGGIDRVFQVIGNVNVVFNNLTFTGGRAVDDGKAGPSPSNNDSLGGGILNQGGNITLDHVLVENNTAVGNTRIGGFGTDVEGGGICNSGNLIIISSTIENNEAIGGAGGDGTGPQGQGGEGGSGAGGGLFVFDGTVSLTATTIEANEALGGPGGNGADGTSGNPNGSHGGNGGDGAGGGLFFKQGQLTLASSTLSGNFAGGGAGGNGGQGFAGRFPNGFGGIGGNGGGGKGGGLDAETGIVPFTVALGQGPLPLSSAMLVDTTVADNTATGGDGGMGGGSSRPGNGGNGGLSDGGGLAVSLMGTCTVSNTTVAFNRATMSHGGLAGTGNSTGTAGKNGTGIGGGVIDGTLDATSSIFADNTADGGVDPDFAGHFGTVSHVLLADNTGSNLLASNLNPNGNLFGTGANPIDPKLRPLGFYGGPTQTVALYGDSPAIDVGLNPDGLTSDQRGIGPRSIDGSTDIGAFEFGALPVVAPSPPPTSGPMELVKAFTTRLVRVHHRTRMDVFDAATGQLRLSLFPFGASRGKVEVLTGDVNGDGVADITALDREAHRLRMRVFSGTDLSDLTASLTKG
jgi:hypothetical protein